MSITLPGKLTVSIPRGFDEAYVKIEIRDETSGLEILTLRMGLGDFTEATIGSIARVECSVELNTSPNIGKRAERKEEVVFIPGTRGHGSMYERRIARQAVAPFEVDGWSCWYLDQAFNPHYRVKREAPEGRQGSWQRMPFVRYVDNDGGDDVSHE